MPRRMLLTALGGIPTIRLGDDLAALIDDALQRQGLILQDRDIIVVAQKIVSKAEGRRVRLTDIEPSARALELANQAEKDPRVVELILRESNAVLRCRPGLIIVEHKSGCVMANAGIDASNVETPDKDEHVLLLPENADRSAAALSAALGKHAGCELGIIINDSFGRAWRNGTIGTAIGVAGLPALWDMRGLHDRNGRVLRATEVGVADELAAAASLLMGQGSESLPVVHVRGFPLRLRPGTAGELIRDRQSDLFR